MAAVSRRPASSSAPLLLRADTPATLLFPARLPLPAGVFIYRFLTKKDNQQKKANKMAEWTHFFWHFYIFVLTRSKSSAILCRTHGAVAEWLKAPVC